MIKIGIRDGFKALLGVSEILALVHQQALDFPLGLLDASNPHSLVGNHPLPKSARLLLLQSEAAGLGQKSFQELTDQDLVFPPGFCPCQLLHQFLVSET